jgi:hypothetical protein
MENTPSLKAASRPVPRDRRARGVSPSAGTASPPSLVASGDLNLRFLGWYLAGGAVLAGIIESLASGVVLAQQTSGVAWSPTELRFPWFAFLVGLGVITCARVMRIGVTMREDLDGTV